VNAALHRGDWKTQARQHDRDIRFNRDSGIETPEAWMPTIKKHNTDRKAARQEAAGGADH